MDTAHGGIARLHAAPARATSARQRRCWDAAVPGESLSTGKALAPAWPPSTLLAWRLLCCQHQPRLAFSFLGCISAAPQYPPSAATRLLFQQRRRETQPSEAPAQASPHRRGGDQLQRCSEHPVTLGLPADTACRGLSRSCIEQAQPGRAAHRSHPALLSEGPSTAFFFAPSLTLAQYLILNHS